MKNDKQLLYQVAVRAYWGESGELAYSVRVTPGSVEVYAVSLCETESDALRASVNDCSATRYSMTYATVVGTHDRSSAFVYGAVCCVCACRRERGVRMETATSTTSQMQTWKVTEVCEVLEGGSGEEAG